MNPIIVTLAMLFQTMLDPRQIRPSVQIVEWADCPGPNTALEDCTGISFMRVRFSDGTTMAYTVARASQEMEAVSKGWPHRP